MATYFLRARHLSRGKGARVTRAAAYRAGECIRDERSGEVYDYSDRGDVAHKQIVLPPELEGQADMAWALERAMLWNAAEHAGRRRNSRVAREWLVLLPPELTAAQRVRLVHTFARELAGQYRCALDIALHQPRPGADRRNHHAHLLMTTREVTPDGLGARTALELGGRERHVLGLGPSREEYLSIRERWAQLTNEALREAGVAARVDHRSLLHQGIAREPTPTIPEKVFYAERKSREHSAAGDAIRARHRERVEARAQGGAALARVLQRQKEALRAGAIEDLERRESEPKRVRWGALTRAERNERRRERYQVRRAIEKQDSVREAKRREAARLTERARRQADPEAARAQRRQWRRAHADEVNRKQREYRQAQAQLGRSNAASSAVAASPAPGTSPAAAASTTAESARNWLAYRASHGPGPTAEESARNWLAYRERQQIAGRSPDTAARAGERVQERGGDRAGERVNEGPAGGDGAGRQSGPGRGHDFGL